MFQTIEVQGGSIVLKWDSSHTLSAYDDSDHGCCLGSVRYDDREGVWFLSNSALRAVNAEQALNLLKDQASNHFRMSKEENERQTRRDSRRKAAIQEMESLVANLS